LKGEGGGEGGKVQKYRKKKKEKSLIVIKKRKVSFRLAVGLEKEQKEGKKPKARTQVKRRMKVISLKWARLEEREDWGLFPKERLVIGDSGI